MNHNKNLLNERIGIDRSVICDFELKSIDKKLLNQRAKEQSKGNKSYVRIEYNEDSPVTLEDGSRIGKLMIKDSFLGKFTVSFSKSNFDAEYKVYSSLELMVSGGSNNLQNLNTLEYQGRIIDVFDYLANYYGVVADYSTVSIKKLELNATFYLEEPYEKYREPILLLIRNVPPKRYGNNKDNNGVKFATWFEANSNTKQENLETALVKNSSVELKIYNKGKHLKDIGELEDTDADIMRVEYTIKDKRILDNAFGDNLVASLSDEKITELFKKYFNRDIVARYYQWAADNQKQLIELVEKHRKLNQKWTGTFFRECRQYEAVHSFPVLFDLEDMQKVFRKLEPKNGRNASRKYNKFVKQAIYEDDLIGNTRRVKEIIDKIMNM